MSQSTQWLFDVLALLILGVILLYSGYFRNPEATKDTFSSDGWFMTGDIGRVDDEGFFHVVDRKKELIKYHGVQGNS